jgi:hypothetical protein
MLQQFLVSECPVLVEMNVRHALQPAYGMRTSSCLGMIKVNLVSSHVVTYGARRRLSWTRTGTDQQRNAEFQAYQSMLNTQRDARDSSCKP